MRWFTTVTYESILNHFITKPQGPFCFDCGVVAESRPQFTPEQIADQYTKDPNFKVWFDGCLQILIGARQRDWVPQTVAKHSVVGMRSIMHMAFVSVDHVIKHYKTMNVDLATTSRRWSQIRDPEGNPTSGVLLKQGDLPSGMPFFLVELFSLNEISLREIYLAANETLDEGHAMRTREYLKDEDYKQRGVRVSGGALALTWSEFDSGSLDPLVRTLSGANTTWLCRTSVSFLL